MANNVIIGIPVFNEEKTIAKLIRSLLSQRPGRYVLEGIYILSDGSTDSTEAIVTKLAAADARIHLLKGSERLGKPARINQLFQLNEAAAVVILDGDISLTSRSCIERLVTPILEDGVALTSGTAAYLPPRTLFERIMQTGIDMWNDTKKQSAQGEMYTCEGQIRAFSRQLADKLVFPPYSADDVYPYLYCKTHGLSYRHVPEAIIYYRLPTRVRDFFKQHIRYLHSEAIQSGNFSRELVHSTYVISAQEKIEIFLRYLLRHPVLVLCYSFLLLVPKIAVHFESASKRATWSIIQSTKQ